MVEAVVGRTTSVTVSGGGTKPPNGALVKSQGTERFGKGNPRGCQVRIWKLNASEPPDEELRRWNLLLKAMAYGTE